MEETTNNVSNGEGQNSNWAWVVTGVVVLALILGFYYWPKAKENAETPTNTETAENTEDEYTASLNRVGTSDEVADIEKDLQGTDLDNLDKEAADIEAEVNAQ